MAVSELKKHLSLLSGITPCQFEESHAPTDSYLFYVGFTPPGEQTPEKPEESRWIISDHSTYFFGNVLFSVYCFLENNLGIRWIEPGDQGISFTFQPFLSLKKGSYQWSPILVCRSLRPLISTKQPPVLNSNEQLLSEWLPSKETHEQTVQEQLLWLKRMRTGSHMNLGHGHSFTDWWDKYGKDHPEYFALNKYGKREPESQKVNPNNPTEPDGIGAKETVKLCASNSKVAEQIVQNWILSEKKSKWIGVCENDMSWGFCRCQECKKLDAKIDENRFGNHTRIDDYLTDRYVFLANAVAKTAKIYDSEAGVVMYAYNQTELPPRNLLIEPNVMIGIVPTTIHLTKFKNLLEGWRSAGAKNIFIRPNYGSYYTSTAIPMGFEKQMFDVFQLAYSYGAIATDYDSITGNWPVTGITEYILAKAFSDPTQTFDYWENHYCQAYGLASEDVKAYFRYWRNEIWTKRILPHLDEIVEVGAFHNLTRGVMRTLNKYYEDKDFDMTDNILQKASNKNLSNHQRTRLNSLIYANQHARLIYQAVISSGMQKWEHSSALMKFRQIHRTDLNFPWLSLFRREIYWGDITGIQNSMALQRYSQPWIESDLVWQFQLDPQDVGISEKWFEKNANQISTWDSLRTDCTWKKQPKDMPHPAPELRAELETYNGSVWYATNITIPKEMKDREIFLHFGAIDGDSSIYVNGKLAGFRLMENDNAWRTPFQIQIDSLIHWEISHQQVIIRVHKKTGDGGIWRRVWLVSKLSTK